MNGQIAHPDIPGIPVKSVALNLQDFQSNHGPGKYRFKLARTCRSK